MPEILPFLVSCWKTQMKTILRSSRPSSGAAPFPDGTIMRFTKLLMNLAIVPSSTAWPSASPPTTSSRNLPSSPWKACRLHLACAISCAVAPGMIISSYSAWFAAKTPVNAGAFFGGPPRDLTFRSLSLSPSFVTVHLMMIDTSESSSSGSTMLLASLLTKYGLVANCLTSGATLDLSGSKTSSWPWLLWTSCSTSTRASAFQRLRVRRSWTPA
mmetsp:Transcript_61209/g.179492  ORF Transcript_61209/g.179492 Transcript_61209/m.179492 type:complete len:214 (+) Transcript_61209:147-788(+)